MTQLTQINFTYKNKTRQSNPFYLILFIKKLYVVLKRYVTELGLWNAEASSSLVTKAKERKKM